jgi:head-tail adaptor
MSPILPAGRRTQRVTVQGPAAPPQADGDGGFTTTWIDLDPPTWMVNIDTPTARELERYAHATVVAGRTLIVTGPYHAGITTRCRLLLGTRVLSVAGVDVADGQPKQSVLFCAEEVDPVTP